MRVFHTCHNTFGILSGQPAGNLREDDSLFDLDDLFIQHVWNSHLLFINTMNSVSRVSSYDSGNTNQKYNYRDLTTI